MYTCVYIYIYIYTYTYTCIYTRVLSISLSVRAVLAVDQVHPLLRVGVPQRVTTPSPPTKSFPTKSPRVELYRRLPIKFNGHENSHPLKLRVCLSQTLWNPNS